MWVSAFLVELDRLVGELLRTHSTFFNCAHCTGGPECAQHAPRFRAFIGAPLLVKDMIM